MINGVQKVWKGMVVVLFVLNCLFLVVFLSALSRSLSPEVRLPGGNLEMNERAFQKINTKYFFDVSLRSIPAILRQQRPDEIRKTLEKSGMRFFDVKADLADLQKLDAHLPGSGREYIPVEIDFAGESTEAEMKYRGSFFYHWGFDKKSHAIRFADGRKFNLVNPKDSSFVADEAGIFAAQEYFGLYSPENEWVGLFVNDRFEGVYSSVEELDDEFAKRNAFQFVIEGENVSFARTSGFPLFVDAEKWHTTAGVMNAEAENRFHRFIHALNVYNPKDVFSVLDPEYMVNFYAWTSMVHTRHFDLAHNWRMGYRNGKLYPIVWDSVPWFMPYTEWNSFPKLVTMAEGISGVEEMATPISHTLRKNVYFNQGFAETLWANINRSNSEEEIFAVIDDNINSIQDALDQDIHKGGSLRYSVVTRFPQTTENIRMTAEELKEGIQERDAFLRHHLSAASARYQMRDGFMYVQYSGIGGAHVQVTGDEKWTFDPDTVSVFNRGEYTDFPQVAPDSAGVLLVTGRVKTPDYHYAKYCPMTYRFPVPMQQDVILELTHSLTGQSIPATETEKLIEKDCNMSFYNPWKEVDDEEVKYVSAPQLRIEAEGTNIGALVDFNEKNKSRGTLSIGTYSESVEIKKNRYSDEIQLKLKNEYKGAQKYMLVPKNKETEGFLRAQRVARKRDMPVAQSTVYALNLNGFDAGEYVLIQELDKAFFETQTMTFDTDIYQQIEDAFLLTDSWEKVSSDPRVGESDVETLERLLHAIESEEVISNTIDVDYFINVYNFLHTTGNENPEYVVFFENTSGRYKFIPYAYSYYRNTAFEIKDPLLKEVADELMKEQVVRLNPDGTMRRGQQQEAIVGEELLGPLAEYRKNSSIVLGANSSVVVDQTVVIPSNMELILEKGVDIEMSENTSVISYGKVTVRGTKESPVRIHSQGESPFGVFAIVGKAANGSAINGLEVENGSETFYEHTYLSGMFSAYHVPRISITQSTFVGSHSDDGLNIKYGHAEMRNVTLTENSADAIDFDFVDGVVRNSTFQGNGNDSIDVSGSDVVITDNVIESSGDKCISVGEHSRARVRNSQLRECKIGIESKDLSSVVATHVLFEGNDVALNAYQKKTFFGGGNIRVKKSVFKKNRVLATLENTFIGERLNSDDSKIVVDEMPDLVPSLYSN